MIDNEERGNGREAVTEVAGGINRREAIRRVSALLGGITFVGGTALLNACSRERAPVAAKEPIGQFTTDDIALLDEIADTILPETKTPGAKAAQTGAFMALMVTDTYEPKDQQIFRDGMKAIDAASQKANGKTFMAATPQERLAVLETLDKEQKAQADARDAAAKSKAAATKKPQSDTLKTQAAKEGDKFLPDQRQEKSPGAEAGAATAVTMDTPAHYFRMMKELALLGYFTSEIGCTQAQRYVESPGRFDPCVPYAPGEKSWAGHA